MHRLPNRYSVTRFRFAAALLLGKWLLVAGSVALLGYALWVASRDLTDLAVALMGLAVLVMFAEWLVAARARCPLCIGFPLAHNTCATHRDSRRLLGSYRLRVAMAVVFQGWFRCPYCGEPTVVAVRRRRH